MSHPDVPHGTFWTHTTCSFPLRRTNYIVPAEKPISYEHDLALPHIHPHSHRENVWKYPLFLVRPFVRRHLVFLPRQTHIVYDAHIRSQNNNFLFYNHNFANGDFCAGIKSYNSLFIHHYSNVVVSIHFDSLRLLYDLRPVCQEGVQAIGSCGKLRLAQVGVDFVGGGD